MPVERRDFLGLAAGAASTLAVPAVARAQWLWWLRAPRDWAEVDRELAARFPDVPMVEGDALATELASGTAAPLLLDARTPAEWATSRLPRARPAFDDATTAAALAGVPTTASIVAYCAIGLRSARLARRLAGDGRPGVRNLRHGIFGWADAGRPLVDDRGPARLVHPYDEGWGRLLSERRRGG